jgi:serine/threonine protein phosphatase PrpC
MRKIMVFDLMPFSFISFGMTDVGCVRRENQDVWSEIPELDFYLLADGMGGHRAGDVAANEAQRIACELAHDFYGFSGEGKEATEQEKLKAIIRGVNLHVCNLGKSHGDLKDMGTTIVLARFSGDEIFYAHVGDSRLYRLRDEKLLQMTIDHSLAEQLIKKGELARKDVPKFAKKHRVTRAIGLDSDVKPAIASDLVKDGDVYLLCSDGLTDLVTNDEIQLILSRYNTVEEMGTALVDTAKMLGGLDNITVVLIAAKESKNG